MFLALILAPNATNALTHISSPFCKEREERREGGEEREGRRREERKERRKKRGKEEDRYNYRY